MLAQCRKTRVPLPPRCAGVSYRGYHVHQSACFAELYGKVSLPISQVIRRDCGITSVGIRELGDCWFILAGGETTAGK